MIRHLLAAAILASLLFGSSPVSAGPPGAQVIALELRPVSRVVIILIAVNRGVYAGATSGAAPFAFEVTFTYQHQGVSMTETRSVPFDQTSPLGMLDSSTVIVEAFFILNSKPDPESPIDASATVVVAGNAP